MLFELNQDLLENRLREKIFYSTMVKQVFRYSDDDDVVFVASECELDPASFVGSISLQGTSFSVILRG